MPKAKEWAINNKLTFNENKSKVMLMSRRRRREKKEIEIYVNNKTPTEVNNLKYLGIIFDSKLSFRDHINSLRLWQRLWLLSDLLVPSLVRSYKARSKIQVRRMSHVDSLL